MNGKEKPRQQHPQQVARQERRWRKDDIPAPGSVQTWAATEEWQLRRRASSRGSSPELHNRRAQPPVKEQQQQVELRTPSKRRTTAGGPNSREVEPRRGRPEQDSSRPGTKQLWPNGKDWEEGGHQRAEQGKEGWAAVVTRAAARAEEGEPQQSPVEEASQTQAVGQRQ